MHRESREYGSIHRGFWFRIGWLIVVDKEWIVLYGDRYLVYKSHYHDVRISSCLYYCLPYSSFEIVTEKVLIFTF